MFTKTCIALLSIYLTSVSGAIHQVLVGGDTLAFSPNFVEAADGDDIIFIFGPKNHTVTQSSFETPCSPLAGGLDSGFRPSSGPPFPSWSVRVGDATRPFWFHCRQGTHCSAAGMVFAINPGSQFAAFQAAATGAGVPKAPTSTSTTNAPPATSLPTTTAAPPSPSPSPPVGQDHLVLVGDGGSLTFSPNNLNTAIGDTITFEFRVKNHTATQSTFGSPCRPLTSTSLTGQVGFDSGFQPVSPGVTSFPRFIVNVNDTSPIWVFCQQTNHCSQGMVFAANAPTTGNTFEAFEQAAKGGNAATTTATSTVTPGATQKSAAQSRVIPRALSVLLAAVGLSALL